MIVGQFIIVYQNKAIKIMGVEKDGSVVGPLCWEFAKTKAEATVFPAFEKAAFVSKVIQFAYPRQVEVAPFAYDPKDQPQEII